MTISTELLNEELDKIDIVRDRTGLCFEDACNLLIEVNWDVVDALVLYEQELTIMENQFQTKGAVFVKKVKDLIYQGNNTNIRVKTNDRTVIEFPITLGVLGTVLAPRLTLLAGATCLLTKCTVEFNQAQQED